MRGFLLYINNMPSTIDSSVLLFTHQNINITNDQLNDQLLEIKYKQ